MEYFLALGMKISTILPLTMTYLEAIILGIVQGLGEFLPISSSAHLVIVPWLFKFKDPGLTFDVALHFGTLLALIFYFWRDWFQIISGFVNSFKEKKRGESPELFLKYQSYRRLFIYLILATIPGAIAGYLLDDLAEHHFRHPLLIAANMSILGVFLLYADRKERLAKDLHTINLRDSLMIGFSQAFALIPGVSRSGITITTGLFRHLNRATAARFSFLMAAPITLGACVFKAKHFFSEPVTGQALAGIAASALIGFLSIKYLLRYVQTFSYRIFVYYRFAFSLVILLIYLF